MKTWSGRTADRSYGIEIEESALQEIDRLCIAAGDIETGGVLIGKYSTDLSSAIVREATPPPPDSRRAPSWFSRGVSGLRDVLQKRWRSKERTYYVGEWHYHPVQVVIPSSDDFMQMVQIARAEVYRCREPLLVIVGARTSRTEPVLRAFVCPADQKAMEFERTGDQ